MSLAQQDRPAGARKLQGAMLDQASLSLERMPGLAVVFEHFAAEAEKRLAALIDGDVKAAIEETRMAQLFATLLECQGLTAAVFVLGDYDARFLVVFDEATVDVIVHAVFGGEAGPASDPKSPPEALAPLSAIETGLVADAARIVGESLAAALAPFLSTRVVFERLTTLVGVHALGRKDMPTVAARLALATDAGDCAGLVVLPLAALSPLRETLALDPTAEAPTVDPGWLHRMEAGVAQARLPIVAILEELPMTLGDVAQFTVGGLLALERAGGGRVRLDCSGRGMFSCKLGERDGRYLLEIDEPIAPDDALGPSAFP
jgi:flagellar motor switch protein FliM